MGTMKARNQLILSIAFLLSSIAVWYKVVPHTPTDVTPPPAVVVSVSQDSIQGVWEQYSLDGEQPEFMARLDIRPDGDSYIAYPEALSRGTFPKHAYRSFDHVMQDGHWSFKEDWDNGLVGNFDLKQNDQGQYVGVALGSDGHMFNTMFVRVQ